MRTNSVLDKKNKTIISLLFYNKKQNLPKFR